MKTYKLIVAAFAVIILSACGSGNNELIVGTWHEVETGESILHYNKNGTYQFDFDNGNSEKGIWRIEDDILYTTVDGSSEELSEELSVLNEKQMVVTIGGMFQTTYEREKE